MAFVGSFVTGGSARSLAAAKSARPAATVTMMAKSKSVPFMDQPPALDGTMAGDVGFDPLNITGYLDVKWMAEAEIKHCRVTMLATIGWLVQEVYRFPMYSSAPKVPTEAHAYFTSTALAQVALFVSTWEILTTPAVIQMLSGESDRAPGYFGFDPLNFTKGFDPEATKKWQTAELINGRLAMIAIGGFVHQAWLTKVGVIEQITSGKFTP